MTWKIRKAYRELFAAEEHLDGSPPQGGGLSVCLVYPNRYGVAMSNLGFQRVFSMLAESPGIRCERAFLPERGELEEYRQSGTPLLSLESQRPLSDFDVIAFSVSFEPDFLEIPLLLRLAGIPRRSAERTPGDPLVMAGGAALTINPEPVADFIDLICVGEAEGPLPAVLGLLTESGQADRAGLLSRLSRLPGIYVPSLYEPLYAGAMLTGFRPEPGAPFPVQRASLPTGGDQRPAASRILNSAAEFGDMYLMEVSRGCGRGCRFCTSGYTFGAFRQFPYELLQDEAESGLRHRARIGLVGAAVSDHRDIGRLCRHIVEHGGTVSLSSLRIDRIDGTMLDALVASGHRTVALAPEGGSQRMRDLMRKNLAREQILDACDLIISRDILNIKLYFIIGLPGEEMRDLEELVSLAAEIRERVIARARANRRLGEIMVSVNPFIPKPFTPLQWCGMEPLASLEAKVRYLEQSLRPLSNIRLKVESLRECFLQALLSRGDRRLAAFMELLADGISIRKASRECRLDLEGTACRTMAVDETLPWGVIESADGELLRREYLRAMGEVKS